MEPFDHNSGTLFLPPVKTLASPPELHFFCPIESLLSKIPLTPSVSILGKS